MHSSLPHAFFFTEFLNQGVHTVGRTKRVLTCILHTCCLRNPCILDSFTLILSSTNLDVMRKRAKEQENFDPHITQRQVNADYLICSGFVILSGRYRAPVDLCSRAL
jgi:hypothetical protein